jgi:signal transduction histidine kinase
MPKEDLKHWIRTELWDQVPVSIAVINRNFEIVEANRSFVDTYGSWKGRPCYSVYKGRKDRCEDCAPSMTFADGRIRVREEEGVLGDGQPHHYLVRTVPLVRRNGDDNEIPFTIELSTDITEVKLLEKEKLQAERLAAVGETVAGMAHGIKNVLMGLEGGVYVVRTGMKNADSERILRGWAIVEENIGRITAFVKEFLDFAKGHPAKVELVDPNCITTKVIELFSENANLAGIELRCELAADIPPTYLDEDGIHTCLVNLVSNALDACDVSDRSGGRVLVSTAERDGTLVFEVADDGTGMDAEIAKQVFTKFFSTKGSEKGTGLGLLTTKKVVQQHGGTVSFESTEGVGSVFRLEFPRDRLPPPDTGDSQGRE